MLLLVLLLLLLFFFFSFDIDTCVDFGVDVAVDIDVTICDVDSGGVEDVDGRGGRRRIVHDDHRKTSLILTMISMLLCTWYT